MTKRDEQISTDTEIKSWRESEAAAIHVVRVSLIYHTKAASAASLHGDPAPLRAKRSLH